MTKNATLVTASMNMVKAPFDLATVEKMPDWRERLSWPISHRERRQVLAQQYRDLISFVCNVEDDDLRDVLLLGVNAMMHSVRAWTETALAVQRQAEHGVFLTGDQPELSYLQGDESQLGLSTPPSQIFNGPNNRILRRLVRTASWTPWGRLPAAMLAPEAVAVSHNHLLCAVAGETDQRISFRHGDDWLSRIRKKSRGIATPPGLEDIAQELSDVLTDLKGLEEPWRGRLRALIAAQGQKILSNAARDLAALRGRKDLPDELWAGSGGYYPVRALSLEVLRRGGKVRRFDHGGATGFTEERYASAFAEYAVSSEYVMATPHVVRMVDETGATPLIRKIRQVKITGHRGDPTFYVPQYPPRPASKRRRVAYVTAALIGFRQIYPPMLPDPVHLDWQLRLAADLSALPVDFVCRPHPESLHPGNRHPLADVAPVCGKPFPSMMREIDVFVFDFLSTTAFFEAMCTDRPVVFLDLGFVTLTKTAKKLIEQRCRIVPVTYDDKNLPQVDPEVLAAAVTGGPEKAGPAPMRRVLAGGEERA